MIEPMQVKKLETPPLILALAFVKFAQLPLKTFKDAVEQLHGAIRNDYPGLEEVKSQSIELAVNNLGEADNLDIKQKQTEESSFVFSSSDFSWVIIVSPVSLMVCTKKYNSFEDLLERVLRILDILGENDGITHTSNIGLRYINRIDINDDTGFDETINAGFLQPKISGFIGMGGSDMISVYQSEKSWCFVKTTLKIQGLDIPSELLFIAHKMKLGKEPVENVFTSIDINSNTMTHEFQDFDLANIESCLKELHGSVKKAFGSVLTDSELHRRS